MKPRIAGIAGRYYDSFIAEITYYRGFNNTDIHGFYLDFAHDGLKHLIGGIIIREYPGCIGEQVPDLAGTDQPVVPHLF